VVKIAVSVLGDIACTSGTTVRARSIIRTLSEKYEVTIIERASSIDYNLLDSLTVKKPAVLLLVKPEKTRFWNIKLIPLILLNKFKCVYCVTDPFGFVTYYCLSKLLGHKIVFEAHALVHKEVEQLSTLRAFGYKLLEIFIGKKADTIVALSGITHSFYSSLNKSTVFVPVYVGDTFLKTYADSPNATREKVVGIVGPFDTTFNEYQLDFLYRNLDRFDKRMKFSVIGYCSRRMKDKRIEYTGYLKTSGEYASSLSRLNALLVPARYGTYGPKNKILEAMACSLPVFTNPKGIIGLDFAQPNENIFVFKESELVEKINAIIFDDDLMKHVGSRAKATVKRFYARETSEAKIQEAVAAVISGI
jgi:glycosyltransferase involved in cell wall biosynthesis